MAISETYSKLNSFLRRLQQAWQQSGVEEPIKLSSDDPAIPPPSPLQIATNNPDAPAPNLADQDRTFWLDLAPPRDRDREVFSTSIGSGVISPEIHKLMQQSQSTDVAERFAFSQQLRILYENDYTVSACINARVEGACRLGVKQEVIPAEGQDGNPAAVLSAQRGNRAYQAVAALFPTSEREMALREYILYGNIYDRLAWNSYGTITDLMGLPSQTIKILVNSQLKLEDGQFVAYQQFDPMKWGAPIYQFPDVSIVKVQNRLFRSDIYGSTFLLPIIKYVQDNIKTMDYVQRARTSGLPINVSQREDAIGNGIHPTSLAKAKWDSLEERMRRGETPDGYFTEWINGKGEMKRLESSGSYWQGFDENEVRYRASAIAGVLGRSLAMIITPNQMNRASAEWLTESDYDRENKLAVLFCDTHDVALMHKAVFITNVAAAAADPGSWGLEPGRYYIDPRLIKLQSDIVGQVTEDRGMERVKSCATAKDAGTLAIKDAAFITAQAFKLDPQQSWQNLLRENPALRNAYPEDYIDPQGNSLPPQIKGRDPEPEENPNERVM